MLHDKVAEESELVEMEAACCCPISADFARVPALSSSSSSIIVGSKISDLRLYLLVSENGTSAASRSIIGISNGMVLEYGTSVISEVEIYEDEWNSELETIESSEVLGELGGLNTCVLLYLFFIGDRFEFQELIL